MTPWKLQAVAAVCSYVSAAASFTAGNPGTGAVALGAGLLLAVVAIWGRANARRDAKR